MRNKIADNIAYSGKYVTHKGKAYQLVPEQSPRMCLGCAMIKSVGCTDDLTQLCRQGYIYKKVII